MINGQLGGQPRVGRPVRYPMTVRVQAFEIIRTWLFYHPA